MMLRRERYTWKGWALVFLEKWKGQLRAAWAQAGCW